MFETHQLITADAVQVNAAGFESLRLNTENPPLFFFPQLCEWASAGSPASCLSTNYSNKTNQNKQAV